MSHSNLFESFERRVLFASSVLDGDTVAPQQSQAETVASSGLVDAPSAQAVRVGKTVELRFSGDVTGTVYFIGGPSYHGSGWRVEAPIVDGVAVLAEVPPHPVVYLSWYYSGDANHAPISPTTPRRFIPMPILDSRSFDITIIPPAEPIVGGAEVTYGVQFNDPQMKAGEWFGGAFTVEVDGRHSTYPWWVDADGKGQFQLKLDAGQHMIRVHFSRISRGAISDDPFHANTVSAPVTVDVQPAPGQAQPMETTAVARADRAAVRADELAVVEVRITPASEAYVWGWSPARLVQLYDDQDRPVGPAMSPSSSGIVMIPLTGLATGVHRLHAVFSDTPFGQARYARSVSAAIELTVSAPQSKEQITLRSSKLVADRDNASRYPATLTLFFAEPGKPIPAGKVLINGDAHGARWVDLDAMGRAVVTGFDPGHPGGSATITWAYTGDAHFAAAADTQKVYLAYPKTMGRTMIGLKAQRPPAPPRNTPAANFAPLDVFGRVGKILDGRYTPSGGITGMVEIVYEGTVLGTAELDATGSFALRLDDFRGDLSKLRARYSGDTLFDPSEAPLWNREVGIGASYGSTSDGRTPVTVAVWSDVPAYGRVTLYDGDKEVASFYLDGAVSGFRRVLDISGRPASLRMVYDGDVVNRPRTGLITPPAVPSDATRFVIDTDGDGIQDEIYYDAASAQVWVRDNGQGLLGEAVKVQQPAAGWRLAGVADFDGDGKADLLWTHDAQRKQAIWRMHRSGVLGFSMFNHAPRGAWVLDEVKDIDNDGDADLVWRNTKSNGKFAWLLQGTTVVGGGAL